MERPPGDQAAGSANGVGVDLAGWDGVVFEAIIGVIGNGGTYDLRVVDSANSNFSGAVNVTDKDTGNVAGITQVLNTGPNVIVSIDVFRPTNRYVRVVSTATTNNVNVGIVAHKYRAQGRTPYDLPTNNQYVAVRAN